MSENADRGQSGEAETQQALLRHTIDLNTELIAQADRLISASRGPHATAAEPERND